MTRVKLINQAGNPGSPAAGSVLVYSKTDKKLYLIDDAGLVTQLGAGTLPGSCSDAETIGALTATSDIAVMTPHANAHTKGVYTQLIASSAFDSAWLVIMCDYSAAANVAYLVDIATGGAGAESVKISNLQVGVRGVLVPNVFMMPYKIAAGSRIAARCQCSGASGGTLTIQGYTLNGIGGGFTTCETIGASAATSLGVALTGGAANVKGNWTQISAAISAQWKYMIVVLLGKNLKALTDIGIGANPNEVALVDNLRSYSNYGTNVHPLPLTVASATRITARTQNTGSAAQSNWCSIYGFY